MRLPASAIPALALVLGCATATTPVPVGTLPSSTADAVPGVLPFPREATLSGETVPLPDTLRCAVDVPELRPLVGVMDYDYRMLAGGRVEEAAGGSAAPCRLALDPALAPEAYRLDLGEPVVVTGGSYAAVARGTAVLMQALRYEDGRRTVPRGTIRDDPGSPFRGLLIDVARAWHDIDVLEQVVLLARWYGINHLQLHLTDDNAFTFPSAALPALPTPDGHYTRAQLRTLDRFARERGVTLVPEIEMPGHSGQFTARMPDVFGVEGSPGSHTLNMGREPAYAALDTLLGEVAAVFETTPYIHIGGDEAVLDHLEQDPDVVAYMARHRLPDVRELYRHFLVRADSMVRRRGRRTVLWEGFGPDGIVEIPTDILVMAWETIYQLPQELLANGYEILNVSWKPLYVANVRKWDPEEIYAWNLWRWENWYPIMPSFTPIQIDSTPRVRGGMMASWAQPQHAEIPSLRRRLPAMAERLWTPTITPLRTFAEFDGALARADSLLGRLLSPIRVAARGLRFPELGPGEGHYREETWFRDSLTLALEVGGDTVVRYTLDGRAPTAADTRYLRPIRLGESAIVGARAFAPDGTAIGYPLRLEYQLRPVEGRIDGTVTTPLDSLWEKPDRRVPFRDSVRVHLDAARQGVIRYTLDGSQPAADSPAYTGPIRVDRALTLTALLFDPAGRPVGVPWTQGFRPDP